MKGFITKYVEEKGFGFLICANYHERFFHISEIVDRDHFVKYYQDYIYKDYHSEHPKLIEFLPSTNSKGLSAIQIVLTPQILNNLNGLPLFKARITDIEYEVESISRTVSGFNKGSSGPEGATAGSNGTHRIGYPETFKSLFLSFRKEDDIGWG
jgi:hypothetical protein